MYQYFQATFKWTISTFPQLSNLSQLSGRKMVYVSFISFLGLQILTEMTPDAKAKERRWEACPRATPWLVGRTPGSQRWVSSMARTWQLPMCISDVSASSQLPLPVVIQRAFLCFSDSISPNGSYFLAITLYLKGFIQVKGGITLCIKCPQWGYMRLSVKI